MESFWRRRADRKAARTDRGELAVQIVDERYPGDYFYYQYIRCIDRATHRRVDLEFERLSGRPRGVAVWIGLWNVRLVDPARPSRYGPSSRLTALERMRVKEAVEAELVNRGISRVEWIELPEPEDAPPSKAGTVRFRPSDGIIDLSTALADHEQLRHLWALLGRELAADWHLNHLLVREQARGPSLRLREDWNTHPQWFLWDAPHGDSPYYGVARGGPNALYPLIALWAPLVDLVIGFRSEETVTQQWLPRIDAAARAGRLPVGERGFLIHSGGAAMRVFVPAAETQATLALLAEAAKTRGLVLEEGRRKA